MNPIGAIRRAGALGERTTPEPRSGELWFLLGLPGAGKSTFAGSIPNTVIVSIDAIRAERGWEIGDPRWMADAYVRATDELEAALAQGHLTVFDSSGLLESAREDARHTAGVLGRTARLLYLATDPDIARERQRRDHPDREPLKSLPRLLAWLLDSERRYGTLSGWDGVHTLDSEAQERAINAWSVGGMGRERLR